MTNKQILIISAVEKDRGKIIRALREAGHVPLAASSGEEGLQLAAAHHPHVIILDVMMPGLNGFEVCQRLKRSAHTQSIPILILTGHHQVIDIVRGLEVGADAFFPRSVKTELLLRRIEMILDAPGVNRRNDSPHQEMLETSTALLVGEGYRHEVVDAI